MPFDVNDARNLLHGIPESENSSALAIVDSVIIPYIRYAIMDDGSDKFEFSSDMTIFNSGNFYGEFYSVAEIMKGRGFDVDTSVEKRPNGKRIMTIKIPPVK